MGSQVDLDELAGTGETPAAGAGSGSGSSARSTKRSSGRPAPAAGERKERELEVRLGEVLDRIAGAFEARGDDQLAGIIREDGPVMARGLVSLTRPLAALRAPLLGLVAVVEPALAFGRLVRELLQRRAERRAAAAAEPTEPTAGDSYQ